MITVPLSEADDAFVAELVFLAGLVLLAGLRDLADAGVAGLVLLAGLRDLADAGVADFSAIACVSFLHVTTSYLQNICRISVQMFLFWFHVTMAEEQFGWRFGLPVVGNVVGRINEVNQCRAQLVLGWVIICRWVNHLGM